MVRSALVNPKEKTFRRNPAVGHKVWHSAFKGSSDIFQTQAILFLKSESDPTYDSEIEWWISRKTQNRLKIQIQSRYMSEPFHSDIDFKNKMTLIRNTLKNSRRFLG